MSASGSRPFDRIAVVVCDGMGCGLAPDAAEFDDTGANTLGHVIEEHRPALPNLYALGLGDITGVPSPPSSAGGDPRATSLGDDAEREPAEGAVDGAVGVPVGERAAVDEMPGRAARGRMIERSPAKDTMTGHWELMGLLSSHRFPTYPEGFPPEVIEPFEEEIGRPVLGNRPASGTEIIVELGARHLRTGHPIVYTSGDSVFQVAAHRDAIPVEDLYEICRTARELLRGEHGVGRVIARPFTGEDPDSFRRLDDRRRDYSLPPPGDTVLDHLVEAGFVTHGVGKVHDIFAGRGLSTDAKTPDNDSGVRETRRSLVEAEADLILTNLVEFDSLYGHRRDPEGYARALERLDRRIPELVRATEGGALLVLTADHGTDPTHRGTDHTRECVPLLAVGPGVSPARLGTRASFADLGATIAENFGLEAGLAGTSFLPEISRTPPTG